MIRYNRTVITLLEDPLKQSYVTVSAAGLLPFVVSSRERFPLLPANGIVMPCSFDELCPFELSAYDALTPL